jgi:hypothetical protein
MRRTLTKRRELKDVIDRMLEHVPEEEWVLVDELRRIRTESEYVAPEAKADVWQRTHRVLATAIGEPTKSWEIEVTEIFSGRKR